MHDVMAKKDVKPSVRISLNDSMREAFTFLKKTRYPFMKEDEMFKLAFSRLYASQVDEYQRETVGYEVLKAIQAKRPQFGISWLEAHDVTPESLSLDQILDIIKEEI